MKLLDLSTDVLRQIMIHYIDNSEVNKIKVNFIGSKNLIGICDLIQLSKFPLYYALIKCNTYNFITVDEIIALSDEKCDYVDINGNTALMLTYHNDTFNVASKIIDAGCELVQKKINNDDEITKRLVHVLSSHMFRKILYKDCKQDQVNIDGDTALMLTCKNNKSDIALKLLEMGSSCKGTAETVAGKPDHVNTSGCTALLYACQNKMSEVALKLLNIECNPGHVDKYNQTALLYACQNNMMDVALKILDLNCNPKKINIHGDTALSLAHRNNMMDVVAKINKIIVGA
jgi:ankyrin repeat protein